VRFYARRVRISAAWQAWPFFFCPFFYYKKGNEGRRAKIITYVFRRHTREQ
jgi:hypothetical protein